MFTFSLRIYAVTVLVILASENCNAAADNVTMVVNSNTSIYYNPRTQSMLPTELGFATRLPSHPIKFISRGLPCTCADLKCGCCTDINITTIKFYRHACTNVTVLPEEFAVDFDILIDDKQVFTNRLTARNPPPACVPLYFFPAITFCVRFFDLHFADSKMNVCIDFETKVVQWPMFVLHFNCMKVSGSGITWERPPGVGVTDPVVDPTDSDVYDHVNFEVSDENAYLHTSTLTPEEENQIGTLKL